MWAVVSIAFAVNNLVPGDPARMVAGAQAAAGGRRAHPRAARPRPTRPSCSTRASGSGSSTSARASSTRRPIPPTRTAPSVAPARAASAVHVDFGKSFQKQPARRRPPRAADAAHVRPRARGDARAARCSAWARASSRRLDAARGSTASSSARACSGSARRRSSSPCVLQYVFARGLGWLPLDGFGTTIARARALPRPARAHPRHLRRRLLHAPRPRRDGRCSSSRTGSAPRARRGSRPRASSCGTACATRSSPSSPPWGSTSARSWAAPSSPRPSSAGPASATSASRRCSTATDPSSSRASSSRRWPSSRPTCSSTRSTRASIRASQRIALTRACQQAALVHVRRVRLRDAALVGVARRRAVARRLVGRAEREPRVGVAGIARRRLTRERNGARRCRPRQRLAGLRQRIATRGRGSGSTGGSRPTGASRAGAAATGAAVDAGRRGPRHDRTRTPQVSVGGATGAAAAVSLGSGGALAAGAAEALATGSLDGSPLATARRGRRHRGRRSRRGRHVGALRRTAPIAPPQPARSRLRSRRSCLARSPCRPPTTARIAAERDRDADDALRLRAHLARHTRDVPVVERVVLRCRGPLPGTVGGGASRGGGVGGGSAGVVGLPVSCAGTTLMGSVLAGCRFE